MNAGLKILFKFLYFYKKNEYIRENNVITLLGFLLVILGLFFNKFTNKLPKYTQITTEVCKILMC